MIAHNGFPTWQARSRVGRNAIPSRTDWQSVLHQEGRASMPILRRRRAAFTLMELMVVIMLISILASTVLFAMFGAVETARDS